MLPVSVLPLRDDVPPSEASVAAERPGVAHLEDGWEVTHTQTKNPKSEKHEENTSPSCCITVKLFHRTPTLEGSTNVEKFALQTGQTSSCVPTSQKWNWPKNIVYSVFHILYNPFLRTWKNMHFIIHKDNKKCKDDLLLKVSFWLISVLFCFVFLKDSLKMQSNSELTRL